MVVGRASSKYGEAEGVAAGSGCGRGLGCRGRAAEGVSALLASGGGERNGLGAGGGAAGLAARELGCAAVGGPGQFSESPQAKHSLNLSRFNTSVTITCEATMSH